MSPLKLSVIVCGAAAGLAVAPYVVKQILPPVADEVAAVDPASTVVATDIDSAAKLDLPIAGPNSAPAAPAALALAAPVKEEAPTRPELHLPAPTLPSPETAQQELALPSLANQSVASAMPSPSLTPAPTPRPTPAPTPEIPYRADVETAQKLMKKLGIDTGKIDGKLGPNTQAAVRDFQKKEGITVTGDVSQEVLQKMETAVAALATPTPAPAPEPTPEPNVVITDADNAEEAAPVAEADKPEAIVIRKEEKKKTEVSDAAPKPKVDPGPVPTLKNRKDVSKLQEQLKEAGTYTGNVDGKWGDLTRAAMREFQEKNNLEVTGKPNKETWLAMHSDAPTVEAEAAEKTSSTIADESSSEVDSMEISSADSIPSLSSDEAAEYVVTVNGDGRSNPSSKSPLPTPATVSSFDEKSKDEAAETAGDESAEKPTVQVSTPARDEEPGASEKEDPVDLAVAEVDEDVEAEKLRKEIESAKKRIQSVSNDSTYEVKKYAPKILETVNSMADELKSDSLEDDPAGTKAALRRIDEELEKAKTESRKKKADDLVSGVRSSYKELKGNFNERIKALSLKDPDEKSQREELTMLVANVDLGFEAMEKDFKAGKIDPIFKNATEFKYTIDQINVELAKLYVEAQLGEKDVKGKLDDDDADEIESLVKKDEHLKAAEMLDKVVSSSSKKKS